MELQLVLWQKKTRLHLLPQIENQQATSSRTRTGDVSCQLDVRNRVAHDVAVERTLVDVAGGHVRRIR
jgi:hypothetical protein